MKVLPRISVSRVVHCCDAMEGCRCSPGYKREWTKPYFGVRLGHRWFFPIGTGMRLNTADKIRQDLVFVLWALGIWGPATAVVRALPRWHPGPRTGCPRCAKLDAEQESPSGE